MTCKYEVCVDEYMFAWGIYSTYVNMRQDPPPQHKKIGWSLYNCMQIQTHSVLVGIFLKLNIVKDGGLMLRYVQYWQLEYNSATQSSIYWSMNIF